MKFFIKTFGCQMNVADSQRIINSFLGQGHTQVKDINKADTVVINSCIVRESAENRVYGLINNLRKKKKKIILTGCLAGWGLKDKTGKKLRVLKKKVGSGIKIVLIEDLADFQVEPKLEKNKEEIAYVPISNGCNHFCTYCIVPYARGLETYRPIKDIIADINCAIEKGFEKIMLLGQSVNSWKGRGKIKTFPQLLETVAKIKGLEEISFMSSNPWDFTDELIGVISKYPNIKRRLHLPIQSGDDQILKKMNRPYTAKGFLKLVEKIRKKTPEVEFTTDIIIGFPGEDDKAFENTVKLCKEVGFKQAFINKYSPRPGTVAAKLYEDNIPMAIKKKRWLILEKLINI